MLEEQQEETNLKSFVCAVFFSPDSNTCCVKPHFWVDKNKYATTTPCVHRIWVSSPSFFCAHRRRKKNKPVLFTKRSVYSASRENKIMKSSYPAVALCYFSWIIEVS